MPENITLNIKSKVITVKEALSVITSNFDLFTELVHKSMPRREHLSLMGKDDVYMRALAQVYNKVNGINSITVVGNEARNLMDYMDILYTASCLKKRNALGYFELDLDDNGKMNLNMKMATGETTDSNNSPRELA